VAFALGVKLRFVGYRPSGSVAASASNASTLMAMRIIAT
jgi:hypothetical protein